MEPREKLNSELDRLEARDERELTEVILSLTPGLPAHRWTRAIEAVQTIQKVLDEMTRLTDWDVKKNPEMLAIVHEAVSECLEMRRLICDIATAMNHDGKLLGGAHGTDVEGVRPLLYALRDEFFNIPEGKYALPPIDSRKLPDPDIGSVWRFEDYDGAKDDYRVVSRSPMMIVTERVGGYGHKYEIARPYFLSAKQVFE